MSKFRVGDRVTVVKGHGIGRSGVIREIEGITENTPVHHVLIDGMSLTAVYYEDAIIFEDNEDTDIMNQEIYESKDTTSQEMKPKFRVGDVVESTNGLSQAASSYPVYVIKESVRLDDGYSYEAAPIDSPDESIVLSEEVLLFQYHDTNWQEYFTEGTRQRSLPAWRGELYNYSHLSDSEKEDPKYNDYTLPPTYMEHIIDNHSVRKRMKNILDNNSFELSIAKEMNCPIDELSIIRKSILTKIDVINKKEDIEKIPRDNHGHRKLEFDDKETRLISLVGYYDKYKRLDENGNGESKDHYPPYMSDYDIMNAIKEAYGNAEKVEKRGYGTKPPIPEGVILFQGTSKDGLKIQFYYQFNDNHIHTAYPVFVDTTNRPDLRHPENKNKKRQN